MEASPWADLHQDLLGRIFRLLPSITDRAWSAAVCRHWRSVALENPPRLPWLLMPSTAGASYFRIFGETTHQNPAVPDYARGARFCGSFPGGWFVVALHQSDGYALLNLHSGEQVPLPDRLRILAEGHIINPLVYCESPMVIHAATMSAPPTTGSSCIVAAITSGQSNIAFWRPGMDHWSPPVPTDPNQRASWSEMTPEMDSIEDVKCYRCPQGPRFYVLTATERLLVYVPEEGEDGALTMRLSVKEFPGHQATSPGPGQVVSRYLVFSEGALVMVKRFISPGQGTVAFQVFKLQAGPSWGMQSFLPGQVIFVGRCCSRAYMTGLLSCTGYIYFLDDAEGFRDLRVVLQGEKRYRCGDTGRCRDSTQEQEIQRRLPREPPSDCSPWIWFFR